MAAAQSHIESLRRKHATIDKEIEYEATRPLPDQTHISELKRLKLRLKEQIQRLETH